MKKVRFIFLIFFFGAITQNPMPQLNVFIISLSEISLFLIHLNILLVLIFDKSIFKVKPSGIDLRRFSTSPPPVMCAAELIRFFFVKFNISEE